MYDFADMINPRNLLFFALISLTASLAAAQNSTSAATDPLLGVKFLVGNWVGEGSGQPGTGGGEFSFAPELSGRVLVRHSYAEYPSTKDRPAFRHDDLMVLYPESGKLRADYWDNEGHAIHYTVTTEPGSATFVSDGPGPRFRLTYSAKSADKVAIKFEIAPPGGEFKTYLEGTARKK